MPPRAPRRLSSSLLAAATFSATVAAIFAAPAVPAAALPAPWSYSEIGDLPRRGSVRHADGTFTLEAAGSDIGGASDDFLFVHAPLGGEGTLSARLVPMPAGSAAKAGLMLRAALSPISPHIAIVITPAVVGENERASWNLQLLLRERPSATRTLASTSLAPLVAEGRLARPCWLRLAVQREIVIAAYSFDGKAWTTLGSCNLSSTQDMHLGLAACSRNARQPATVSFDQVNVSRPLR